MSMTLLFFTLLPSIYQVCAYIPDLGAGLPSEGYCCCQESKCLICHPLNPSTVYQQERNVSPCLKASIFTGVTGLTGMLWHPRSATPKSRRPTFPHHLPSVWPCWAWPNPQRSLVLHPPSFSLPHWYPNLRISAERGGGSAPGSHHLHPLALDTLLPCGIPIYTNSTC